MVSASIPVDKPDFKFTLKVIYLAICFVLMFIAYGIAQNYVTTLHPDVGFLAIGILYLAFGIFSPFAPELGAFFGVRLSFFLSSSVYMIWIVVSMMADTIWFLIMSVLIGVAAALLWNQHEMYVIILAHEAGIYVTILAHEAGEARFVGYLTGIFYSLFGCSSLIGNGLAAGILSSGASTSLMLWVMVAIGSAGVLMFLLLPPAASDVSGTLPKSTEATNIESPVKLDVAEHVVDVNSISPNIIASVSNTTTELQAESVSTTTIELQGSNQSIVSVLNGSVSNDTTAEVLSTPTLTTPSDVITIVETRIVTSKTIEKLTSWDRFYDIFLLNLESPMRCLSLFFAYFGFLTAYTFTTFPLMVPSSSIPLLFLIYGFASMPTPYLAASNCKVNLDDVVVLYFPGMVFDRAGSMPLLVVQVICALVGHLIYIVTPQPSELAFSVHAGIALIFGLSDALVNSLSYMSLVRYYGSRTPRIIAASFALLRLYQCSGIAISCLLSVYLDAHWISGFCLVYIPLAVLLFLTFMRRITAELEISSASAV